MIRAFRVWRLAAAALLRGRSLQHSPEALHLKPQVLLALPTLLVLTRLQPAESRVSRVLRPLIRITIKAVTAGSRTVSRNTVSAIRPVCCVVITVAVRSAKTLLVVRSANIHSFVTVGEAVVRRRHNRPPKDKNRSLPLTPVLLRHPLVLRTLRRRPIIIALTLLQQLLLVFTIH